MRHGKSIWLYRELRHPLLFIVTGTVTDFFVCLYYPGAPTLKAGLFQRRGLVTPGSPNLRRPKDCQPTFLKSVDY